MTQELGIGSPEGLAHPCLPHLDSFSRKLTILYYRIQEDPNYRQLRWTHFYKNRHRSPVLIAADDEYFKRRAERRPYEYNGSPDIVLGRAVRLYDGELRPAEEIGSNFRTVYIHQLEDPIEGLYLSPYAAWEYQFTDSQTQEFLLTITPKLAAWYYEHRNFRLMPKKVNEILLQLKRYDLLELPQFRFTDYDIINLLFSKQSQPWIIDRYLDIPVLFEKLQSRASSYSGL